jgi:hypothetical protein
VRFSAAGVVIGLFACLAWGGDSWQDFRGPACNGCSDSVGLPVEWGETQNVKWKTAIHDRGWSSPALFGDLLILHLEGTDVQFIVALNKKTGQTV